MLKKLTTQSTFQIMNIEERTAELSCSFYCMQMCGADSVMFKFEFQLNYEFIEG